MNMIIPSDLSRTDFESTGEYLVYRAFKRDRATDDWFVLHSVYLQDHVRNLSGEIDFLVLVPNKGIFVLEVKHGMVSRRNGVWIYKGKSGKSTSKRRGPFEQANEALHSLRKYLIDRAENQQKKEAVQHLLMGFGVIFSSMEENPDFGPEAEGWQVMGRNEMNLPISLYIDNLFKGWTGKMKEHGMFYAQESLPSKKMIQSLVGLIKGDFEIKPSESAILQDNDLRIEQFTSEQFGLIEFTQYNKRCLITGSAGTGKTLIALEVATREITKKRRVGLFCYNRKLGEYLIAKVDSYMSEEDDYAVNSFHQFLLHFAKQKHPRKDSTNEEFFQIDLPLDIIINSDENGLEDRFDVLILDEAQDLLTEENLEVFDLILKGGLAQGQWLFFGDFNKQAIYQQDPEKALGLITKYPYAFVPPLRINCRNGKSIILYNTHLTGVKRPMMFNDSLEEFPVGLHFPASAKLVDEMKNILENLAKENLLQETVILSPYKINHTPYGRDKDFMVWMEKSKVRFETIHSFKGLESNIVVLVGFNELGSDVSQRLLYVGISRAKQRLIFILDKSVQTEFQQLIAKNMHDNDE